MSPKDFDSAIANISVAIVELRARMFDDTLNRSGEMDLSLRFVPHSLPSF
jgi:hypothetical protein